MILDSENARNKGDNFTVTGIINYPTSSDQVVKILMLVRNPQLSLACESKMHQMHCLSLSRSDAWGIVPIKHV